jgi:hypothetical protein
MASKRHVRKKACTSKRAYDNRGHAERVASYFNAHQLDWVPQVAYSCRWCGKFHIGHQIGGYSEVVSAKRSSSHT